MNTNNNRSLLQGKGHGVFVSTARCLSKVLNCLKNILRKGVRIYARFKYAIMGTIPYDNRRSV